MGTGKGYGKTILFGEHFVVYGLPSIVSALGAYTTADVNLLEGSGWTVSDQRPATPGYKELKHVEAMQAIANIINHLKVDIKTQRIEISFSGDLIAASGVGASAAQCTSLARALNETFNLNLDDEKINEAAYEGEKAYHGTPSGIDNTASTYGGLIWFVKNLGAGKNTIDLLQSPRKMLIVIANSGITASTAEVVADVRRLREESPEKIQKIFGAYKKLAETAKEALLEGDIATIGDLMNQNHKMLQQITVSGEINDELVKIALENGALGAKLTGTGRGGLVIGLTENAGIQEKIITIIEEKGYNAWKGTIG
ncbi:MAG: mevalonate kinase [Candidatus Bathyarchaeota archaeon]|nr:MAG: mevalonate kinase [Candidatus Bathyarchaeota archaeon]